MDCPVCATPGTRTLAGNCRIFHKCDSCGFIRADPASDPTPERSRARYALHRNDPDDPGYRAYLGGILDSGLARSGCANPQVLDWGSGPTPAAVELLKERGIRAIGWDPLFAPDPLPALDSFDLVFCIEVAEHFTDPRGDFAALLSRLRAGACAIVHTHLAPREDGDFLSWWYMEDLTHVSFYGVRSIELLARESGCRLEAVVNDRLCVLCREAA